MADSNQRIAIAGGSITEILFRLDQQHRIVGVDSTSQFPAVVKQLPLLGYVRNISVEGVLSLQPDLLLGEADTGPTKALNQIQAVGIETVILPDDNNIAAIFGKIRLIAERLNVEAKGKALIEEIQTDIDALAYAKARVTTRPRVLFLLSLSNGAPIAAGHSTSAHTTILEAGGINVLGNHEGWQKLSPESAVVLDPDVVVVMNRGQNTLTELKKLPHFKYSTAVKQGNVHAVDGSYLLGFGPRTPQAIVELGTMIHPDFPLPADYTFRYPNSANNNTAGH